MKNVTSERVVVQRKVELKLDLRAKHWGLWYVLIRQQRGWRACMNRMGGLQHMREKDTTAHLRGAFNLQACSRKDWRQTGHHY